jgi:hypothetical protein
MRVSICCTLLLLSTAGMAFAQDTNFATGPQYLMNPGSNNGSPFFTRPISTPSLSLVGPPLEIGASNATEGLVAGADDRTESLQPESQSRDVFPVYYGAPPTSVVEISFPQASGESTPPELPASILDTGVWQITTVQALRERGYGVTLVEAAVYGKAHAGHATHTYTNADIDRLHSSS